MQSMTGVDWAKIEPSEALAQLMRQDREGEPDAPIGGWRREWAVQREYKRTGSLAEVAELLGDSKNVARDHYVYALTDYREVDRSIALARLAA